MKKTILTALVLIGAVSGASDKSPEQVVKVQVTEAGFGPPQIKVKSGSHVILKVTRTTEQTCATEIQIKEKKIKQKLDVKGKEESIDLGVLKKGDIRSACGMDMISGHIIAE